MLVRLKSYLIRFLKVKLTHPDNATGSLITPAHLRLNWTQTGRSVLHLIDSPRGAFDSELEQHKFVAKNEEESKNPVRTRGCMHWICTKSRYEVYNAVKLSMFSVFDMDYASHLLTCLQLVFANWKVQ